MQDNSYITPQSADTKAEYPIGGSPGLATDVFTLYYSTEITADFHLTTVAPREWDGMMVIEDANGTVVQTIPSNVDPFIFQLGAGTYTLKSTANQPSNITDVDLTWEENAVLAGTANINTVKKQLIGGVRVEKVITKENASATPITKKYTYETFSDVNQPDRSSGRLVSIPQYHFNISQYTPIGNNVSGGNSLGGNCHEQICSYRGITSSSRAPLGVTQGSHIAYTEVTEWYGETGENGKIENTYSFANDKGGGGTPFIALTSFDWKRGHLLKSVVYKNDNGSFIPQQSTENIYDFREDKTLKNNIVIGAAASNYAVGTSCAPSPYYVCDENNIGHVYYACDGVQDLSIFSWINNPPNSVNDVLFGIATTSPLLFVPAFLGTPYVVGVSDDLNNCDTIMTGVCFGMNPGDIIPNANYYTNVNYKTNAVISQWIYVSSTIEKIYDENGQHPITTITEYTYDEDDTDGHQTQPIEVAVTNSEGIKHITKSKYVADYPIALSSPASYTDEAAQGIAALAAKNRISIPVETLQLIEKPGEQPKIIGGILRTYKDFGNDVIMPKGIYKLETNIPLMMGSSSSDYQHSTIASSYQFTKSNQHLRLVGTIDEYDNLGNLLTYHRPNDISTSIFWDNAGNFPIAKAVNAAADEIFYTSFEEDFSTNTTTAKTGVRSKSVANGYSFTPINTALAGSNTIISGDYLLTYWKKTGSDWEYKEEIKLGYVSGNTISTEPFNGWIDEVRLMPIDALMSTVTYHPNTHQITHMANENGQIAHFEYDDFQRLEHIYDFDNNLISKYEYNYKDASSTGNDVYNYIKTWTFLAPDIQLDANNQPIVTDPADKVEQIQFMDGLGRPMQSIAIGQATDFGDIVSHVEYDDFGRADKQFLPFVTASNNNGAFVTNAAFQQSTYNLAKYSTDKSYAQSSFEASPMNRVLEQGATGNDWQIGTGHTIRNSWRPNAHNEVYDFENSQYYPMHTLMVTETIDENDIPSYTYTDKLGRTILTKRRLRVDCTGTTTSGNSSSGGPSVQEVEVHTNSTCYDYAATYYIYDDFGRIEKVLPPTAVELLSNINVFYDPDHTMLSELIYEYTYDERGRMIEKKIPGAAIQYLMYDELDRVVLTQDGNLRASNEWLFTEYDILSRPIATGIYTNSANRTAVQSEIDGAGLYETRNTSFDGYTENAAFPTNTSTSGSFIRHTISYYDNYDFDGDGTDDVTPDPTHLDGATYAHLHGKLTGTRVKILDNPSTNTWLKTVTFYDERGRVIQIYAQNHMSGADVTSNQYDFTGRLLKTVRDHSTSSNQLFIASDFEYDHAGRLLFTKYGVGNTHTDAVNAQVVLSALEYDQIGQMVEKKLHSTDNGTKFLQNVDFEYNIRGWLSSINNVNDMSAQGSTQLVEITTNWNNPHSNANTYYYGETHLMPGQDGAMELTYDGTIRTYCSWRRVLPDGSDKPMMQLVKHTNGSWYVWDKNFSTRMSKPASFVAVGQKIRLERVGDEFRVYVGGQLKHTIVEVGSSQEEMIPVGILSNGGQTQHAFYRHMALEGADVFAMRLDYTVSNTTTEAAAQYNGNISQVTWKSMGDTKYSVYGFQYDDLNRLTQAKYAQYEITGQTQQLGQPSNVNYSNMDNYSVSNITYDLNGNIQTLDRRGWDGAAFSDIDGLTYTYQNNSNILDAVADAEKASVGFKEEVHGMAQDYEYDANGNMTKDRNKGIAITYNYMNLPTKISWLDIEGDPSSKHIAFVYDAAGVKLYKKTNDENNNTFRKDYVGGIEYADNTLEAIYHSEGRLRPSGSSYQHEYTIKDHLGNARVSFADIDNDGEISPTDIIQTNHYYPFGMKHEPNTIAGSTENTYQYNGKELNTDFGLDWLDYGARWYDASIARWSAVDPHAESYYQWTPYNYVYNNPLSFIDPDGRDGILIITGENTATVKFTVHYSKEQLKDFKNGQYSEDDLKGDFDKYFKAKSGKYEINGEEYDVNFELEIKAYETNEDLEKAKEEKNIKEGETVLKFDENKKTSSYSDVKQTITLSTLNAVGGVGHTGGTFSHELLHSIGLEHPNDLMHNSGKTGPLSSYAQRRELQEREVEEALSPALQLATDEKVNINQRILVTGANTRIQKDESGKKIKENGKYVRKPRRKSKLLKDK